MVGATRLDGFRPHASNPTLARNSCCQSLAVALVFYFSLEQ